MSKLPPFKSRGPFLVQALERNFIEYLKYPPPACPTQKVLTTLQGREGSKRQIQFQLEGREPKSRKAFHPCLSLLRFQFADSRKHRETLSCPGGRCPDIQQGFLGPVTEIPDFTLGFCGLLYMSLEGPITLILKLDIRK